MNIFMSPKIAQKQSSMSLHWKHQENTLYFTILIATQRDMQCMNQKEFNVKTLPSQAIY